MIIYVKFNVMTLDDKNDTRFKTNILKHYYYAQ